MTTTETDEWVAEMENETAADTPVSDLRDWAQSLYPLEAATELLIRAGFAQTWRPWVKPRPHGGWWIDFDLIPRSVGDASGGERRFLLIAASLGSNEVTVGLEDMFSGLDRGRLDLVLAAIAHAGGSHEHPMMQTQAVATHDGGSFEAQVPVPGGGYAGALHEWPEDARR